MKLSDEAIETLTIDGYHEPITSVEIEEKRQKEQRGMSRILCKSLFG